MRRFVMAATVVVFGGLSTICFTTASASIFHPRSAPMGATTCATKHCPANTHCCTSCTGNPVCIKGGIRCPECAPP